MASFHHAIFVKDKIMNHMLNEFMIVLFLLNRQQRKRVLALGVQGDRTDQNCGVQFKSRGGNHFFWLEI